MLRGKIERVSGNHLYGWLWDTVSVDPVQFELLINDLSAGVYKADILRGDLKQRNIGDGRHAFRISLEPNIITSSLNRFTVIQLPQYRKLSRELFTYTVEKNSFQEAGTIAAGSQSELFKVVKNELGIELNLEKDFSRPETDRQAKAHSGRSPAVTAFRPLKPLLPSKSSIPDLDWDQQRDLLRKLIELGKLTEKQIAPIIESSMKSTQPVVASILGEAVEGLFPYSYRVSNNVGRSQLNLKNYEKAIVTLNRLRLSDPGRHGAIFYLGVAYARAQKYVEAYEIFVDCITSSPSQFKYHLEAARMAVLIRFGGFGVFQERPEFYEIAIKHFSSAYDIENNETSMLREYSRILVHGDRLNDALQLARRATEVGPNHDANWSELSKILLRLGMYDQALDASQTALKLSQNNDGLKFNVRILTRLSDTRRHTSSAPQVGLVSDIDVEQHSEALSLYRVEKLGSDLEKFLIAVDYEWLCFDPLVDLSAEKEPLGSPNRMFQWAGGVEIGRKPHSTIAWRRDFLLALITCGAHQHHTGLFGLLALAERTASVVFSDSVAPDLSRLLPRLGIVLLVSQYGIYKFGGAEQFMLQMAGIYTDLGFQVIMVGTRSEHVGQSGMSSGFRYTFIDSSPEEMLRLSIEEKATVVHVVSGLGFEIASALRYLNVRLVFGVHFWRELFFNPTPSSGYFPDIDRKAIPRPDFKVIIDDFHAVYSNSVFTRRIVEQYFGVRTPIIFSLPDDVELSEHKTRLDRDYVLLVNARADKGFDFMAEVALRTSEVQFIGIASQSDLAAAKSVLARKEVTNISVISRAEDMSSLYRSARIVLVPSFRFIETFSRVVIEAHRFGTPVIGSDRGNVPHLLTESGVALAEEPELWADEIQRLWSNDEYWSDRSRLALENSRRYAFSSQKNRLKGLLSSIQSPILIGVGSGLGNVIHTTPLIRNISRRLGRRVDVVVAGDYSDLLFVTACEEYVNMAMLLNDVALRRRYDTVFLTHSFGSLIPPFASNRIIASRDWDNFSADHRLHEAEFNLAAAQALLEVPYDPDDVHGYYIGDLAYYTPSKPLIGLHGGSKDGIWASKRWPHFVRLAEELGKKGIPVASFGTAEEYVQGTIDMTGGSIEEMTRRMLACSVFVSNDSGVMNVANALGIPLIALFGPTNVLTRGPLAHTSHSIAIEKPCAPCEIHETERKTRFLNGSCGCIEEIDVGIVLDKVLKILEAGPVVKSNK